MSNSGSAPSNSGNPISYSAVIDTLTHNSPAPTLGAAGTTTVDPDFGSSVMRVTQNGSCGQDSTANFGPNEGTGWLRTINSNDTAVLFVNNSNGAWFVQPVTLNGSSMSLNGACIALPLGGTGIEFEATNPNLVYGLDPDGMHFDTYNWTNGTTTQVLNIRTIPGFNPLSLYLAYCDGNDSWCATSNNSQDVGTQIAFYNLKTGATAVVDIDNQTVQIGSGSPQAMTGNGVSAGLFSGCGIHEIMPGYDGVWFGLNVHCPNAGTSLPQAFDNIFWKVGTTNVAFIQDNNESGGHEAMGNSVYTADPGYSEGCPAYEMGQTLWQVGNFGGGNGAGNWVGVTNCGNTTFGALQDMHFSWNNDAQDSNSNSYPVMIMPWPEGGANSGQVYEWEIDMVQMSVANGTLKAGGPYGQGAATAPTIWRIAHTYNDSPNAQCNLVYVSPNISQDGKYGMFYSDWMGQTGNTGICTNNRRTDLFIVQLPLP